MIEVSPSAQAYFRHLLAGQDEPGMGLRISVVQPGTPDADCDLQFCPSDARREGDRRLGLAGFELFVAGDSVDWLEAAEIDFEEDETGGQLTIRAPNIKGSAPADDRPLDERVRWVLDCEVNPQLAAHGGRVTLLEVTPEGEAVLQFGGGCHGCGMVSVTLKEGIEKTLRARFPDLAGILDATDHRSGKNPYYAPGA